MSTFNNCIFMIMPSQTQLDEMEIIKPSDNKGDTTNEFFCTIPKRIEAGSILEIEGDRYIVIEQKDSNKYLIMTTNVINKKPFQIEERYKRNMNIYQDSDIDVYLEYKWYPSLSQTLRYAIQPTRIKQTTYTAATDPNSKYDSDCNNIKYSTLSRYVFLPSVEEIGKIVDLKKSDNVVAFLNGESIWTRDCSTLISIQSKYINFEKGTLDNGCCQFYYGVRPAFVVDLTKVQSKIISKVNYKL